MSKIHSRDVFADTQIERFINRNLPLILIMAFAIGGIGLMVLTFAP